LGCTVLSVCGLALRADWKAGVKAEALPTLFGIQNLDFA
jgi:hypothetical protein